MTTDELLAGLVEHDKGVLKHGAHSAGMGEFCALALTLLDATYQHSVLLMSPTTTEWVTRRSQA